MTNKSLNGILFILSILTIPAKAAETRFIEEQLEDFYRDPQTFYFSQSSVTKYSYSPQGVNVAHETFPLFSESSIKSQQYVLQKKRSPFFKSRNPERLSIRSQYEANDDPSIMGELASDKLQDMEERKLTSGHLSVSPWSDYFWPILDGVLANRYSDENYPNSTSWKRNVAYLSAEDNACAIEFLSPAEKYDLLVGDKQKTLTKTMLNEGAAYFEETGNVEPWMGICHGWAVASFMEERPKHSIIAIAQGSRVKIPFYPSDIKALASLLWANADVPTNFVGSRCEQKHPPEGEAGRIIDPECFDTNPGTWHLVVVNQIGVENRPFVFDSSYDYEVWNQPISSYSYRYFNPETRKVADSLKDAAIPIASFMSDKFKKYRNNPKVTSVVGVAMEFVYIAETFPNHNKQDGTENDRHVVVNYLYDLELDSDGKIVGGEWYQQKHPDFIFAPKPGSQAMAVGDAAIDTRSSNVQSEIDITKNPIPKTWKLAAVKSSRLGQPLNHVLKALIQAALVDTY